MIFFCTDNPKKQIIESFDESINIIDYNFRNNFYVKNKRCTSYKELYKKYNFISYLKFCEDIKINVLYSVYDLSNKSKENITFLFDVKTNNIFFLNCVDSLIKRKILNKKISNPIFSNKIVLNISQVEEILNLSRFFIKTKVVTNTNNFFDFVYNFYLSVF